MVAARQSVRSVGITSGERCMLVEDAIEAGQQFDGMYLGMKALRIMQNHPEIMGHNVRVADQAVVVEHSGCIPEHEHTEAATRLVVTPCPKDIAQRCGNCILGHVTGRDMINALGPLDPIFTHTDCF